MLKESQFYNLNKYQTGLNPEERYIFNTYERRENDFYYTKFTYSSIKYDVSKAYKQKIQYIRD